MQHIFDTNHTAAARNTQTLGEKPMKSSENLSLANALPNAIFSKFARNSEAFGSICKHSEAFGENFESLRKLGTCS